MVIRIGPAGWSYPDWEGVVYPRPHPRGFHALPYLARWFDVIEINSSFYALPDAANVARWVELAQPFEPLRFSAKLPQELTHGEFEPRAAEALAREFSARLTALSQSGRLLGLLAQFPVSFRADARALERVERLREWFDRAPLVLELRHASWFEPARLERLERLGVSLAHIDLPASRSHPPTWHRPFGPLGYLRLHGRNATTWFQRGAGRDQRYDYLYGARELGEIAERARRLSGEHDETAVVTNNHFAGQAVLNALELRALLSSVAPTAPAELVRAYPERLKGYSSGGQGELFR